MPPYEQCANYRLEVRGPAGPGLEQAIPYNCVWQAEERCNELSLSRPGTFQVVDLYGGRVIYEVSR